MKNYIMATAIISLFVSTQIVPMDRKPSTKNLIEFENSLRNFLKSKRQFFLSEGNPIPVAFGSKMFQFKQNILYMVEKYHIDRSTAEQIFTHTLMDIVIQEIALRNHTANVNDISEWNDRWYPYLLHSIRISKSSIFGT